jgi:hypothetical protein
VCSISGSIVSFMGVGTCTVDANQSGDASYSAAPQVQQSFSVSQGQQAITSPKSATATMGSPFSFSVTTTGLPVPSITKKGKLPRHLSFVDNGHGTATISGVPANRGVYNLTIKAIFGTGKSKNVVTQHFTLTVSKG